MSGIPPIPGIPPPIPGIPPGIPHSPPGGGPADFWVAIISSILRIMHAASEAADTI